MGVSGQHDVPAALYPRGKDPPVPIVQDAGWAPEPAWTQRIEEKSFAPCRGSNLDRPVVQPVARHYTDWATRLSYKIRRIANSWNRWFIIMGWDYVFELLSLTDMFISLIIWVWNTTVKLYRQGKTEELCENPVPMSLCPQIPHGLTQARPRGSAENRW
jgi:hypothetical protein